MDDCITFSLCEMPKIINTADKGHISEAVPPLLVVDIQTNFLDARSNAILTTFYKFAIFPVLIIQLLWSMTVRSPFLFH